SRPAEIRSLDGQRLFGLYAPLPNTDASAGMGFITLLPYERVMHYYLWLRAALILVTVLAVIIALIVGTAMSRGLTRPVESVAAAAQVIRDGGWPEPIPTTRTDELGLLQSVFNEMVATMKAGQDRLLGLLDT